MFGNATDPVCGMKVSKKKAEGTSVYRSKEYYFCSMRCKEAFDSNPERYAGKKQA